MSHLDSRFILCHFQDFNPSIKLASLALRFTLLNTHNHNKKEERLRIALYKAFWSLREIYGSYIHQNNEKYRWILDPYRPLEPKPEALEQIKKETTPITWLSKPTKIVKTRFHTPFQFCALDIFCFWWGWPIAKFSLDIPRFFPILGAWCRRSLII